MHPLIHNYPCGVHISQYAPVYRQLPECRPHLSTLTHCKGGWPAESKTASFHCTWTHVLITPLSSQSPLWSSLHSVHLCFIAISIIFVPSVVHSLSSSPLQQF